MNKSRLTVLIIGLIVGALIGALGLTVVMTLMDDSKVADTHETASNNEPLYWVAPMDPNFQRDQPGKSPMGMDLVPVYAEAASSDSPGTVKIDPLTVQNLGVKTVLVNASIPSASIKTLGSVKFAEDAIVHIHPRVAGWIETLNVRSEGEFIAQGAPLYSLYSPDLVNAQEELLIALEQNNQALIRAAKSRLAALNAPASLIQAIQKRRKIERSITFYAPQGGYVSTLNIQEGFYVTPSTTMLAIANMKQVWVFADIFASDASKIEVGQSAVITSEYLPGVKINTNIDYIYPTLNAQTRTLTARFVVDNADRLFKPDMFTTVVINTQGSAAGDEIKPLIVPQQSVIRTGRDNRVVLALGEGKFKSIQVTLGESFDNGIEIVEGLREGDNIVVSAQFLLDSESSISSDFKRMSDDADKDASSNPENNTQTSAWTKATVNEVWPDERLVNLTHGPLDAFNMMGMTMNFMVDERIDISQFKASQNVHVEIVKTPSGMFSVKTVHFMDRDHHSQGAH